MQVKNADALDALGTRLKGKFDIYDSERRQLELQWLRNLRQYKAIYDADVKIPEGKSKVYPKDTHTKIVGWVAKMMEMMFPAQEKNWDLIPTPFPNIAKKDLDSIIAALQQEEEIQAQQQTLMAQQQDPNAQPVEPRPLTSDQIERAVRAFAEKRAEQMIKECETQLDQGEVDYPELCKKVIRRGGIYGYGVAKGPIVKTIVEREWMPNPESGKYEAVERPQKVPYYMPLKAWDFYPDLSAMNWRGMEGVFERMVLPRNSLYALAVDEDFFGGVIREYLKEHKDGNYKARSYEADLNEIKKVDQNAPQSKRQYEIIRWYGYVSASDLAEVGVDVPGSAMGKDILADIWLLDEKCIKADLAPFGERPADMYHAFIFEDDEDSPLTGTSKVEVLRDSQMKLCSVDRATMDNMAGCAASIVEVNDDLLAPGESQKTITGGVTIHRQGEMQEANYPAIRTYSIDSHLGELTELRRLYSEILDTESNLPAWRMGDAKPLGEAFRTSNNMSMMAGGGDMVTKDDARAFDRFVSSLIGSLVKWNMKYNDKEEIKGDYRVQPKGAMSLVAKEVRGMALDQLVLTLTPRERVMVDERGLLMDRFKSRDLPVNRIKDPEEAQAALDRFDQAQASAANAQQSLVESQAQSFQARAMKDQAQAEEIGRMMDTKIQDALSSVALNLAKAKGEKDNAALSQIQLLLDALAPQGAGKGTQSASTGASSGE